MIGVDIGGANLKVVDEVGAHIHYCPLWKKTPIREILQKYASEENAAVVMSGELADCFSSKQEGIEFIVQAVQDVFPDAKFYGTDGMFHSTPVPKLAAANWLVMADVLRNQYPRALLVDMGSTTTDIIPLHPWDILTGQTDFTRLREGLLVYYGVLRTPVSSLLRSVLLDGKQVGLSTEYFACSGDVHLLLEMITPEIYTIVPPDGADPSIDHAMRRMARMVCADPDEIGIPGILEIARSYVREEQALITRAVTEAQERYGCDQILAAGIGSGILSTWCDVLDLNQEMGSLSDAMPAWAVREAILRTA